MVQAGQGRRAGGYDPPGRDPGRSIESFHGGIQVFHHHADLGVEIEREIISLKVPESHRWKEAVKTRTIHPLAEVFGRDLWKTTLLAIAFSSVALIGTWGCKPELYPEILDLIATGKLTVEPFVEAAPVRPKRRRPSLSTIAGVLLLVAAVAGLLAGILYNWWMIRTRSLGDCILAHAVTNAALSVFVIVFRRWEYWL